MKNNPPTVAVLALLLAACAPDVAVVPPPASSSADGGAGGSGGAEPFCHELPLVVPGLPCIEGTTCKAVCHTDGRCCSGPRLP